jgi:uncharacterized protein (DUF1330 family)
MKQYMVIELVTAKKSWIEGFMQNATRLVEEYGGRFLARTTNVQRLEGKGDVPQWILLIEFPSPEAAANWYTCAKYQLYLEKGKADSFPNVVGIPGEDLLV